MEDKNDLTLPQAALRLSVSWNQAYKLLTRGALGPARQVAGRYWMVTAAGLDAYQAQHSRADRSPGFIEPGTP